MKESTQFHMPGLFETNGLDVSPYLQFLRPIDLDFRQRSNDMRLFFGVASNAQCQLWLESLENSLTAALPRNQPTNQPAAHALPNARPVHNPNDEWEVIALENELSVNGGVISGHWGGAKVVQFMLRLGA